MSILPLKFHILSRLCGFSGWLAFSLAAHGAIFGWLVEQARLPAGSGAPVLQVALVEGGSTSGRRHLDPVLRGTSSPPPFSSRRARPQPATHVPVVASPAPTAEPVPERLVTEVELIPAGSGREQSAVAGMVGMSEGRDPETGSGEGVGVDTETAPGSGSGMAAAGANLGHVREGARLARQIRPVYPPGALAQGWEGQVLLRLQIAADGSVQQVLIERSSGYEALDRAARRAARSWLFYPARQDGVPVAADVRVPVVFAREGR